jgi:hypothetical protein
MTKETKELVISKSIVFIAEVVNGIAQWVVIAMMIFWFFSYKFDKGTAATKQSGKYATKVCFSDIANPTSDECYLLAKPEDK